MGYVLIFKRLYRKPPVILPQPYTLFLWPFLYDYNGARFEAFDLFLAALGFKIHVQDRRLWNKLPHEQKQIFSAAPLEVHRHFARIRHGYAVAHASTNDENPFYELSLYPWEIIKDKLRSKVALASDVYDWHIHEAFLCTKQRMSPKNVYVGDATINGWELQDFADLLPAEQAKYVQISDIKSRFIDYRDAVHANRPFASYAFMEFVGERKSDNYDVWTQEVKQLSKLWKRMLPQERAAYGPERMPLRRRDYKEFILEQRTALVMDYIFEYGAVRHFSGDWHKWRHDVAGDLNYLDKIYSPVVVMSDKRYNITFRDRIPSSVEEVQEIARQYNSPTAVS